MISRRLCSPVSTTVDRDKQPIIAEKALLERSELFWSSSVCKMPQDPQPAITDNAEAMETVEAGWGRGLAKLSMTSPQRPSPKGSWKELRLWAIFGSAVRSARKSTAFEAAQCSLEAAIRPELSH